MTKTYGFDPEQPGVKRLLKLANGLHISSTVRLRAPYIDGDGTHSPGELVRMPEAVARKLVVSGSAETVDQ